MSYISCSATHHCHCDHCELGFTKTCIAIVQYMHVHVFLLKLHLMYVEELSVSLHPLATVLQSAKLCLIHVGTRDC